MTANHEEGAVTICDTVGVVHLAAGAVEEMQRKGESVTVTQLGDGRIGLIRDGGEPSIVPEMQIGGYLHETFGVLDALDALSSARRPSPASRVNPFHLLYYGDPALTGEPADELDKAEQLPLQVIDAMRRALAETNGLGISAPHVGAPLRICIVPRDGKRTIMINPRILKHGRLREYGQEVSISAPGFHCAESRWKWVTVEYFDESATRFRLVARLEGLEARILQHQIMVLSGFIVPPGLTRQQRRQCERIGARMRGEG